MKTEFYLTIVIAVLLQSVIACDCDTVYTNGYIRFWQTPVTNWTGYYLYGTELDHSYLRHKELGFVATNYFADIIYDNAKTTVQLNTIETERVVFRDRIDK